MIYNFNLGIGWASSGVEYAQAYRARMFRNIGQEAKFVFTDMFPIDNIEHMTKNIGFQDSEIIWLYTFFSNIKTAPVSYTLKDLENTFDKKDFQFIREGNKAKYIFEGENNFYTVYLVDDKSDLVHRVEMVSNGCLIRKDYYTYCRIYSEYYAPLDNKAHLYHRRYFNEDGTIAYEEIIDGDEITYRMTDRLICSKEDLVGYMVSKLNLTEKDVVIIDRATGIGQTILQNVGKAHVISVVHADHFSEGGTDENNILWNNFYEYLFSQHKHVDCYVTATDAQNQLLKEQFKHYLHTDVGTATIPVGSLDQLRYPKQDRKPFSLITASRLASEKHVDWIIKAVVAAKEMIPGLTLDIYGKGGEESALRNLINEKGAGDYIRLCGQQNLTEIYKDYEAYISASTSEGFGLTLMEAVGSGLPLIGFDVRYGNPTFIQHEKNGYLIESVEKMDINQKIESLKNAIIRLFTEADLSTFHDCSYQKAHEYLGTEVEKGWKTLLEKMI